MSLWVFERWSFNFLGSNTKLHFLPELIKALEIKHTLIKGLDNVSPLEDIGSGDLLSNRLKIHITIKDERTEANNIQGRFSLF